MSPALRWATWVTTVPMVVTGALYAWMAYALEPADPLDVVNHPWQPTVLHLHVLVAPAWLVVLGMLWSSHVVPKLQSQAKPRRRSGLAVLGLALPMLASGYLLQTAVDDGWRTNWRVVHVVVSAAWTGAFGGHVWLRLRRLAHSPMPSRARSAGDATSATVPGGCT